MVGRPSGRLADHRKDATMNITTNYQVEIDGAPRAVLESFDNAKEEGLRLGEGHRAVSITVVHHGPVPSDAYYWDYEVDAWVHVPNAVHCKPKRRDD